MADRAEELHQPGRRQRLHGLDLERLLPAHRVRFASDLVADRSSVRHLDGRLDGLSGPAQEAGTGGHQRPGSGSGHAATAARGQGSRGAGPHGGREGAGDPAGNNGTVKITPHGEVDGIPQNTPHVGCVFDVEWYGFDEGADIVSDVTFESWAPTRVPMTVDGPTQVLVGGDPASGAGTDEGFDGEATYRLAFDGEPHPQQGYHVKLTIHTPARRMNIPTRTRTRWSVDRSENWSK